MEKNYFEALVKFSKIHRSSVRCTPRGLSHPSLFNFSGDRKTKKMKRALSASRVSDKMLPSSSSSSSSQSAIFRSSSVSSALDSELYLPMNNPFSHAAKKERRRFKLAKAYIHFIPVVVVFCAVVLWLFSDPGTEITRVKDAHRSTSTI